MDFHLLGVDSEYIGWCHCEACSLNFPVDLFWSKKDAYILVKSQVLEKWQSHGKVMTNSTTTENSEILKN